MPPDDRFAAEGYLAFSPDLEALYDALRNRPDVARMGSVGFCYGGRMSLTLGFFGRHLKNEK